MSRYYQMNLTIDGQSARPETVLCLKQGTPFPGGHSYNLIISSHSVKKIFLNIAPGHYQNLSNDICTSAFSDLERVLWEYSKQYERIHEQPKYFLNSISSLDVSDNQVIISGVCSRIKK